MNASATSAARELPHPAAPREANSPTRAQAPTKSKRSTRGRSILLGIVAVVLLGWGGRFAYHAFHYEETDDAYVTGHLHTISPQVTGEVAQVLADDNQVVRQGDVLVRLDALPFQLAVDHAQAALAEARAQERQLTAAANQADAAIVEAKAHVAQSEAQLTQAQAQLDLANVTLARSQQLLKENSAAQSEFDQAHSAAEAAAAAHQAAQANLNAARAAVNSAAAAQTSAHAQVEASQAAVTAAATAVRDAQRQLSYATITAPSDGRIGNRHVEPGNEVQAGQALFALAEPNPWVVANFKETQLPRMRVGQEVELEVDALPGHTLRGRIDSFSPASGAEFALLPPDNSTGNFNKVVQRVPVKITFDPDSLREFGDRLRLGLSVVVSVKVR